ncbi:MAG: hypothetical protein ACLRZZ_12870 [Enterocloster sp.]
MTNPPIDCHPGGNRHIHHRVRRRGRQPAGGGERKTARS